MVTKWYHLSLSHSFVSTEKKMLSQHLYDHNSEMYSETLWIIVKHQYILLDVSHPIPFFRLSFTTFNAKPKYIGWVPNVALLDSQVHRFQIQICKDEKKIHHSFRWHKSLVSQLPSINRSFSRAYFPAPHAASCSLFNM